MTSGSKPEGARCPSRVVVGCKPAEAKWIPFQTRSRRANACDERVLGYLGTGVAPPIPLSLSRIRRKPDVGLWTDPNPADIKPTHRSPSDHDASQNRRVQPDSATIHCRAVRPARFKDEGLAGGSLRESVLIPSISQAWAQNPRIKGPRLRRPPLAALDPLP